MRSLALVVAVLVGLWLLRQSLTNSSVDFPTWGNPPEAPNTTGHVLPADVDAYVQQYASAYGLDPNLIRAQAWAESRGKQSAVSKAGAIGVMQLMPGTASDLGVDPYDTEQNVAGGTRFMADLLAQFGDYAKALAAYNWGPGRVARAGDSWYSVAPKETQDYVNDVLMNAGYWPA